MKSLDVMRSKPGIYWVVGANSGTFLEVLPEGKVFSLNLKTLERDNALDNEDAWVPQAVVDIHGPFYREQQDGAAAAVWLSTLALVNHVKADIGTAKAIMANIRAYDDKLNEMEIPPNGDDYNAIWAMFNGAKLLPKREGR